MINYRIFEKILEKVQTVFNKSIKEEKFVYKNSLFNTKLEINIMGQGVERSYEDRSVYFDLKFTDDEDLDGNKKDKIKSKECEFTTWINGEKAIELGQMLISHGLYSLESNMVNHQKIHHYNSLKSFLDEDRIEKIILTKKDENIKNYGNSFTLFNIKPVWKKNKAPKYQEDFEFEDIICFSSFEKEFKDQLKNFGGINKVEFVNYDHNKEVIKFNKFVKSHD